MSRTRGSGRGTLAAAILGVLSLVLAQASTAIAEPAMAPPGNSAVSQYTEQFPTANGPRQSSSTKEGDELPTPRQALGARNAEQLQEEGPEGRELAELAAVTAPAGGAGGGSHGGKGGGAGAAEGSSGSGSVVGQALGTSSSGKLGVALPLILLATVVWAILYAWRRRPRSA